MKAITLMVYFLKCGSGIVICQGYDYRYEMGRIEPKIRLKRGMKLLCSEELGTLDGLGVAMSIVIDEGFYSRINSMLSMIILIDEMEAYTK